MSDKPNPGSKEASELGCICPVLDNGHGRGAYQDETGQWQFWVTGGCPVHDPPRQQEASSE